jgi:hypothetical protein
MRRCAPILALVMALALGAPAANCLASPQGAVSRQACCRSMDMACMHAMGKHGRHCRHNPESCWLAFHNLPAPQALIPVAAAVHSMPAVARFSLGLDLPAPAPGFSPPRPPLISVLRI